MSKASNWVNWLAVVLCGKHRRQIGRVVRVISKTHAAVCFERLTPAKISANCAILTIDKLKRVC